MDPDILDHGLTLALAFGPEWLQPIQERLASRFPALTRGELDEYDACCRAVRDAAQRRLGELAAEAGDPEAVEERWRAEMRAQHPWIGEENLRHLCSQARYYLHKGGLG